MTGDLVERLRAALDRAEEIARAAMVVSRWNGVDMEARTVDGRWTADRRYIEGDGFEIYDEGGHTDEQAAFIAEHDPASVLRTVAAHRKILEEHAPILAMVEWPHDQNGKGEAMVCPRCQNADHTTNWHPPVGGAGVLPEGFVAPYILAPCNTLLALAAVYFPEAPDAD